MFYKIIALKTFEKFRRKHRYRSVLFNKFAGLRSAIRNPGLVLSCKFHKMFNNIYVVEHLRTAFLIAKLLTKKIRKFQGLIIYRLLLVGVIEKL